MQNRGRGRDNFFDPFASFSGFGSTRDLMSSFFSRDPFNDPFFTHPFECMFGSSAFGPSMFGNCFGNPFNAGFIEHEPQQPHTSKGIVIKEISTNEENDHEEKKDKPTKHSKASKELFVQDLDEQHEEMNKHVQYRNEYDRAHRTHPQTRSYSFQSSSITYGGAFAVTFI